jgi:uncharacterized protein (DUF1684 family)
VYGALALLCAALVAGCGNRPPDDPQEYLARVASTRAVKDAAFQGSSGPVPNHKKAELLPLVYFPIDPEYHVLAALTPAADRKKLMIPTSTGQPRAMSIAGTLEFTLKGQPMKLTAFVEDDLNRLTVMFKDMTNGTETYEGGRYIELDRTASRIYELDFNSAFNPYCAYNASYECPLPPPENRLEVRIAAGERVKNNGKA